MYFYDPATREARELVPGISARTFWGEKMLLAVVELKPESVLPHHAHPHEQAGIVLEGELRFTIDDQTRVLHAGEVYVIPGSVHHSAVAGANGAKVMDIFSPVREEYTY